MQHLYLWPSTVWTFALFNKSTIIVSIHVHDLMLNVPYLIFPLLCSHSNLTKPIYITPCKTKVWVIFLFILELKVFRLDQGKHCGNDFYLINFRKNSYELHNTLPHVRLYGVCDESPRFWGYYQTGLIEISRLFSWFLNHDRRWRHSSSPHR